MFNGIVETVGIIKQIQAKAACIDFTITTKEIFHDLFVGESIAVNGVCLTVTSFSENTFNVTAVPETLRISNLGDLIEGRLVNIERSMKANSRIGGHYVQGHVDGVGEVLELQTDGDAALLVTIKIPSILAKYIVNKGYIALDGMSITVIHSVDDWFTVTFIPHTQQVTIINQYCKGTKINIEVDILSKYVEKLLGVHTQCNLASNALKLL